MAKNHKHESAITPVEYGSLQQAFERFNKELFDSQLPDCFIVYSRRSHSGGHFAPNRFSGRDTNFAKHEVSLNPDGFIGKSDEYICSILVHEMTHCWQEHCSDKKRKRYSYHDKEWAAKMKTIGLQPSNSGMVGGKETGVHMSHYILVGGPFQVTYQKLAATGWRLNLQSAAAAGKSAKPRTDKTTFTCPNCGWTLYGKADSEPGCGKCNPDAQPRMQPKEVASYD
jgi:predicted SprT family Zn-dependent metalloprotease/predicted RNA-binding Zn-ribbon protein involved in translation (DUF1610 family)